MNRQAALIICISTTSVVLCGSSHLHAAHPYSRVREETVDLGRQIFEHNWARPDSWLGPEDLGVGGDGLGPVFNEVSCVACHHLGGTGGAGTNVHNVDLLSVDLRQSGSRRDRLQLLEQAHRIHPQFTSKNATVVLHHFGFGPQDEEWEYQGFRDRLISPAVQSRFQNRAKCFRSTEADIPFELAHRSTPPLWGLGLIEKIRQDRGRNARKQLAQIQKRSRRGVSGRVPRTLDGEFGWYGWRGHVSDLRQFVINACANELGLEVP